MSEAATWRHVAAVRRRRITREALGRLYVLAMLALFTAALVVSAIGEPSKPEFRDVRDPAGASAPAR